MDAVKEGLEGAEGCGWDKQRNIAECASVQDVAVNEGAGGCGGGHKGQGAVCASVQVGAVGWER